MEPVIGIRREDKNKWERRAPLVPRDVADLVRRGLTVIVQPSPIRVFPDDEYARAGAVVQEDLSPCRLILAVKEIPAELFLPGRTYVFFSHTIKGQPGNMPMLRRLMELGCGLIDYERITDGSNRRLLFFGRHAGHAGMVDTLHLLGQRLRAESLSSPFWQVRMAHAYFDLEQAKDHVREVGLEVAARRFPRRISPLVFGFAGYGNVSRGAQEVFDCLPFEELRPRDLLTLTPNRLPAREVFKVVFREEDLVEPLDPSSPFRLEDYYAHPERYRSCFERYLEHLTVVLNCIYWEPRYPRLVTREAVRRLHASARPEGGGPRLKLIADLSCDLEGAIEFTVRNTDPDHPAFTYLPAEDRIVEGVDPRGVQVMAIDNLPCELPREASEDFSQALLPFVEGMARADTRRALDEAGFPDEVRKAVVLYRGKLTPAFAYLEAHVAAPARKGDGEGRRDGGQGQGQGQGGSGP